MESQRSFLVIALAICSFFLYTAWQEDHAPKPPKPATEQVAAANGEVQLSASGEVAAPAAVAQTSKLIQVSTDVLDVSIDTAGGDIVGLHLPKYTVSLEDKTPYSLMRKLNGFSYTAQSGLLGDGPDEKGKAKPIYTATQEKFTLANGQTELVVSLTLQRDELNIEKRYTFTAGKYDVRVEYFLTNNSVGSKVVQPYYYLAQTIDNGKAENMMMPVYRGGAYSTAETRYEKFSFDDMKDAALDQSTKGGWISMIEHYFVSAWVPAADQQNQLFTMVSGGNLAVIGSKGPQVSLAAGEQKSIAATFYAGPKDQEQLEKIAPGLDLTVDYGFLWFLSQPLFWLMELIHGALGNWGLAIIGITILVKGVMYPLTKKQYESMAKMRNLKPKIDELQARYKDNREKMGPAMMELYRKEKVNPMGGCLPMLIQMPIFLALYWMFAESVELRQAPFFLWIQDLSAADPFYVLPVLYILSMYAMQKLTPMTVTDPMQQKIMLWMPVVFGVFFVIFPAGLVLYWVVSNLLSLAQMVYIYRDMEKRGLYVRG
jgi:YidC/Oxa1 family membrane protein insertase